MNAGEIAENFDLTKATISHHLKLLKNEDLIYETKKKNLAKCFDNLESKFGKNIIQTGFHYKKEKLQKRCQETDRQYAASAEGHFFL